MQEYKWGPWFDWEGGDPPVGPGTLVEADAMTRLEDLYRCSFVMGRIKFVTQNGDSFRLEMLDKSGPAVWLIYRYRVWGTPAPDEEIDIMELLCGSN